MILTFSFLVFLSYACKEKDDYYWIKNALDVSVYQLNLTAEEIADSAQLPRSTWVTNDMRFLISQMGSDSNFVKSNVIKVPEAYLNTRRLCDVYDWTSGFFPGSQWYAYELTADNTTKLHAIKYTNMLNPLKEFKDTHDLGFMVFCSFGNAERLSPNDTIPPIIIQTADII